jgi:hypothetical protein
MGEYLDELDRRRAERDDEMHRAASARRRSVELFQNRRREVLRPAIRELERELRQRRHTTKVVESDDSIRVTVAVRTRQPRSGSLLMKHDPGRLHHLRLEYEGIEILIAKYDVELRKVDHALARKALMRLVERLLLG